MKTLLLMRHAKSDWDADYGTDHDRPLNERGRRSARAMGQLLAEKGLQPDLILSSTALRARSTAMLADEAGRWGSEILLDETLYGGGTGAVIEAAASVPDVGRLMLVGHQPTWSMLVLALTGERVDMKTATVAVVDLDIIEWRALPGSRGILDMVYQPRDHLGDTSGAGSDKIAP
ncbi:MAG TPA: histidine phosphatase family protein [Acidimicrobiia bacterium]|nr:histidine phosphatase family protein [Acidimicrobiia bacterium]